MKRSSANLNNEFFPFEIRRDFVSDDGFFLEENSQKIIFDKENTPDEVKAPEDQGEKPMIQVSRSLHIFDLDHTLLKGNSCYQLGIYLFKCGDLSFLKSLSLLWRYFLASYGKLSLIDLHTQTFERLFLGKPKAQFVLRVQEFIAEKGENLFYLPALMRLREAQNRGDIIAICSSAPDFLVESFSRFLNIQEWCGSKYLVDKRGAFCVISLPIQGEEKAKYVHLLQVKHFFERERVIAYSDSIRDLPFLQAAGIAIGVRPDPALMKVCQEMKWEIL